MKRRMNMAGSTPWKEIKRKRDERIARNTVESWLKDCLVRGRTDLEGGIPDLNTLQTELLLYQIEGVVRKVDAEIQVDRDVWKARAICFGQWIARIKREVSK
jgi:hypothetical protein